MNELPDTNGIELPNIEILNEEEVLLFADTALVEAGKNLTRRGEVINQICDLIFKMDDPVRQSIFVDDISKRHKISKKAITDRIKTLKDSVTVIKQDSKDEFEGFGDIDRKTARKLGFFEHHNCFYFLTKDGPFRASNFIIRPLFHIYSKTDNKRLVEIINEDDYHRTIDI
ncbi:MAG: hypothetical protein NTU51_06830, partial [Bacteroidetes bacterium]|nr:hypothetical protein [Bacteroidota bacterium]